MKRKKRTLQERGAAAVEFGLLAPFLFMLLFGITEFGIILYDKVMVTNASREGARAGMVYVYGDGGENDRLPTAEIKERVNEYLQNHLISLGGGSFDPDRDIQVVESTESFGEALTVTVNYRYNFLVLPNFATGLMGDVNLSGETVMRKEYQPEA